MSIYEKDYLAIILAVDKWRHYLEGHKFIIKTDHESLKYLLEKRIHTSIQKKGITKLLSLDYEIQSGKDPRILLQMHYQGELIVSNYRVEIWMP